MDQLASLPQKDNNGQLLKKWFSSATTGDLETIEQLLDSGEIDINQTDNHGCTAPYFAISELQTNVVNYLIEHGANINIYSWQQRHTPFTLMINRYLSLKSFSQKEIAAEYRSMINNLPYSKSDINKKMMVVVLVQRSQSYFHT